MNVADFEKLLDEVTLRLTQEARKSAFIDSKSFENRVRAVLIQVGKEATKSLSLTPPAQVFPDIVIDDFGIEVKFTTNDTWRSIANSVFEGTRSGGVKNIYLIFGKMGGTPEVKWGRYEDCVMHVRTSHVPRFEVEIDTKKSLFETLGLTYQKFCALGIEDKMGHIRKYARGRLKPGERLWWLDDQEEPERTFDLQVRLFMKLPHDEKRRLRAEAALLCPQITQSSRMRGKYNDAVMYILTNHGVLCPQARDLFTAGSVAGPARGGKYLQRSLKDIEKEMLSAAEYLDNELFVEYWKESVKPKDRIGEWLKRADEYATDWTPSKELFIKRTK